MFPKPIYLCSWILGSRGTSVYWSDDLPLLFSSGCQLRSHLSSLTEEKRFPVVLCLMNISGSATDASLFGNDASEDTEFRTFCVGKSNYCQRWTCGCCVTERPSRNWICQSWWEAYQNTRLPTEDSTAVSLSAFASSNVAVYGFHILPPLLVSAWGLGESQFLVSTTEHENLDEK